MGLDVSSLKRNFSFNAESRYDAGAFLEAKAVSKELSEKQINNLNAVTTALLNHIVLDIFSHSASDSSRPPLTDADGNVFSDVAQRIAGASGMLQKATHFKNAGDVAAARHAIMETIGFYGLQGPRVDYNRSQEANMRLC